MWRILLGKPVAYRMAANFASMQISEDTLLVDCYAVLASETVALTVLKGGSCTFVDSHITISGSIFVAREVYDKLSKGQYYGTN